MNKFALVLIMITSLFAQNSKRLLLIWGPESSPTDRIGKAQLESKLGSSDFQLIPRDSVNHWLEAISDSLAIDSLSFVRSGFGKLKADAILRLNYSPANWTSKNIPWIALPLYTKIYWTQSLSIEYWIPKTPVSVHVIRDTLSTWCFNMFQVCDPTYIDPVEKKQRELVLTQKILDSAMTKFIKAP